MHFKLKDPKFFSIELSACKAHKRNLELLEKLSADKNHLLTKLMVETSVEVML